ncbi:hypothetical protein [Streptosporangium amethystogenes]|uniref:hypothetical protein n=1 Tax=Streptosporangium amethystogenes TaxID=2002 RepID=UPI0004C7BC5D|nr:hypothetical protein [Streptosporangium amethystogenes]
MIGGIVPVGDDWMISGASTAFPAEVASAALAGVRDLRLRSPTLIFINPEKLAKAREIQTAQRESFIDLCGGDLIVVPGDEVKEKVLAFYRHDYERAGSKSGPWTEPDLPDPGFTQMGMVAIVLDEEDGLSFHPDFDLLQEVFAGPALIVRGRCREVVADRTPQHLRGQRIQPRGLNEVPG